MCPCWTFGCATLAVLLMAGGGASATTYKCTVEQVLDWHRTLKPTKLGHDTWMTFNDETGETVGYGGSRFPGRLTLNILYRPKLGEGDDLIATYVYANMSLNLLLRLWDKTSLSFLLLSERGTESGPCKIEKP